MNKPFLSSSERTLSLTSSGLIAVCLFFVAFAASPVSAKDSGEELTSLTTLRTQVRNLLRQEATLDPGPDKDAAGTALCDLYVILRNDERFDSSEMLRGDAAKVRRRLISIGKKLESQLKREGVPKPSGLSQTVDEQISQAIAASQSERGSSASDSSSSHSDRQNGGQSSLSGNASSSATDATAPAGSAATGSAATGPAATGPAQGANAPGPLPDTGWELVELIQRVVAPDFWDSRGGPGTIRYFAMRRVLVVRATSDVHEQIRDLLMALR